MSVLNDCIYLPGRDVPSVPFCAVQLLSSALEAARVVVPQPHIASGPTLCLPYVRVHCRRSLAVLVLQLSTPVTFVQQSYARVRMS